ncbi:MAG: ABC transporter ATP-binding protein [Pseudomonadota bacterium]
MLSTHALHIRQSERMLLRNLTLSIHAGECWALLGRNGSGKTTLLHTLAGVRPPQQGRIILGDRPLDAWRGRQRARMLGLLPQDASEGFEESVLEAVLSGRHPHLGRWGSETAEDKRIAREALHDCGLTGFETRAVQSLSGGERRRLAIATLLTQATPLMLLDEPLNHLDLQWQWCMLNQLRGLANDGRALFMSLHDPNLALRFCTHALLLNGEGGWQAGTVREVITAEALQEAYGMPMRLLEQGDGVWVVPDIQPG